MNNNSLNINFKKLVVLLLPTCLRKDRIIAFLELFSIAFSKILYYLVGYRTNTIEELKYNGQVCKLEYLLNNYFDLEQRRIQVVDGQQLNGTIYFVYYRDSSTIIDMIKNRGDSNQIILDNRAAIAQKQYDFYVEIPTTLDYNENRLRSLVNTYKLSGKSWKIKTI